ncbi:MAG: transcription elongation factor GreAB [Verrucomicrobiota bacterium]
MNKAVLIQHVVDKLAADLSLYFKAASAARAEATHEQSKAENKYDTRGLEASYLARGQARQVAELETSIQQIRSMTRRTFTEAEPIDLGAYVETERRSIVSAYLLASRAGGTEVVVDGQEVLVITPQSPLGRQLIGHRQGDSAKIDLAGRTETHRIRKVC